MTAADVKSSQHHALVALSVLSAALAVAVWMAAFKRSTPPPLNRISVPTQVRPLASVSHREAPYALSGNALENIEDVLRNRDGRGPIEQSLEDPELDPVDPEAVPVEDRRLLDADPRADLRGSRDPPPAPPCAEVDPEPQLPDDPRDFELPPPASHTVP